MPNIWKPIKKFRTFLHLEDTPGSYAGQGGKLIRVKSTETGLEFYVLVPDDYPAAFLKDGSRVATGDFDLADHNIKRLAAILDSADKNILRLTSIADAVNYLTIRATATGTPPRIVAGGEDTDIDIALIPKGDGRVNVWEKRIIMLAAPVDYRDAVRKEYVDKRLFPAKYAVAADSTERSTSSTSYVAEPNCTCSIYAELNNVIEVELEGWFYHKEAMGRIYAYIGVYSGSATSVGGSTYISASRNYFAEMPSYFTKRWFRCTAAGTISFRMYWKSVDAVPVYCRYRAIRAKIIGKD